MGGGSHSNGGGGGGGGGRVMGGWWWVRRGDVARERQGLANVGKRFRVRLVVGGSEEEWYGSGMEGAKRELWE